MKSRFRAISLAAVALVLTGSAGLAACSTSPDHRSHLAVVTEDPGGGTVPDGAVTGRYLMEGGPIDPNGNIAPPRPIDGQVTFTAGGRTANAAAGPNGDFSIRLDPGLYTVTARTPDVRGPGQSASDCYLPQTVTVRAGATASITVYCAVP